MVPSLVVIVMISRLLCNDGDDDDDGGDQGGEYRVLTAQPKSDENYQDHTKPTMML